MAGVYLLALGFLLWVTWERGLALVDGVTSGSDENSISGWDLAFIIPVLLILGVPLTSSHRDPKPVALELTGIDSASGLTIGNRPDRDDLFVSHFSGDSGTDGATEPYVAVSPAGRVTLTAEGGGNRTGMDIAVTTADGRSCLLRHDGRCGPNDGDNGTVALALTEKPMQISLLRTEHDPDCTNSGGWRSTLLARLPFKQVTQTSGCDAARSVRLTERRSFTLSRGDNGVARLRLDTADAADGGTCQAPHRMLAPANEAATGTAASPGSSFSFANLGTGLLARTQLPISPDCGAGTSRPELAAKRRADGSEIQLRLSQTIAGISWPGVGLFVTIILFAAVVARVVPNRPRFLAIAEPVILSLLAIRMLSAMAATYLSPGLSIIPSVPELMTDALLITIILRLLLWPEARRDSLVAAAHVAFSAIVLAAAEIAVGDIAIAWPTVLAKTLFVAIVWALARAGDAVAKPSEHPRPATLDGRGTTVIATFGGVIPVLAAMLLAIIWFFAKERVAGVSTASLSLILAVVGGGLIVATAQTKGHWLASLATITLFAGIIFFGPLAGRDSGFVLVASGPLLAGLLWAWCRQRRSFAPALQNIIVVSVAIVPLTIVTIYAAVLTWMVPVGAEVTLPTRIATASEISENDARLIGYIAPARLEAVGNRAAFTQLEQQALLDQITQNNWLGQGYLKPANLGNLNDFQLNDNLAAVHIHWPFGRFGLLLLLAVTVIFTLATRPPPLADGAGMTARWIDASATLAVCLLPGITAYMVLANLGLAPFTGRNMVLLSPGSTSDLVEAMILFGAIGLGATWRRV